MQRMTDFIYAPTPIHRVLLSIELNERTTLHAVEDWIGYLTTNIPTNIPSGVLSAEVAVIPLLMVHP
jgi:hypothetical protein